jgi:FkbM family methyltransferase
MQSDLIYDFGVNHGRDTEFYLLKGFRVVGIEANPSIFMDLTKRFSCFIDSAQLVLLNVGVWHEASVLDFYVNLDNDHWSSFDKAYGCRDGSRFEIIDVRCCTSNELIRRFGVPYYMKIDVEGADKHILSQLKDEPDLPSFISVEEFGVASIDLLHEIGYQKFKVIQQRDKTEVVPPNPPAEGSFVPRTFGGTDSGLFGKELPGEWMSYSEARKYFTTNIRKEDFEFVGPEF